MELKRFLKRRVSESTRKDYARKLREFRGFLDSQGKTMDDGEYGDAEVADFLEDHKNLSPSSRNNYLSVIKSFAGWQKERISSRFSLNGKGPNEPATLMMKRDEIRDRLQNVRDMKQYVEEADEEEKNVLTMDQVAELINMASWSDRSIIVMYFYFGFRRMELPTFTEHMDHFDLEEGKIRVDTLKRKKKKDVRNLYYNNWVKEIFEAWEENKIRLVYSSDAYYKKVTKYGDELGVNQLNPTTGRRTFNTHMRDRLDDDPLLRTLTGHKTAFKKRDNESDMTDHYDVSFEEMRKNAMTEQHYFNEISNDLPDSPVEVRT